MGFRMQNGDLGNGFRSLADGASLVNEPSHGLHAFGAPGDQLTGPDPWIFIHLYIPAERQQDRGLLLEHFDRLGRPGRLRFAHAV